MSPVNEACQMTMRDVTCVQVCANFGKSQRVCASLGKCVRACVLCVLCECVCACVCVCACDYPHVAAEGCILSYAVRTPTKSSLLCVDRVRVLCVCVCVSCVRACEFTRQRQQKGAYCHRQYESPQSLRGLGCRGRTYLFHGAVCRAAPPRTRLARAPPVVPPASSCAVLRRKDPGCASTRRALRRGGAPVCVACVLCDVLYVCFCLCVHVYVCVCTMCVFICSCEIREHSPSNM